MIQSPQHTDYTTPIAIFCATILAISLVVASIWNPNIANQVMPIIMAILTILVATFGYIFKNDLTSVKIISKDTHLAVNSQMDAFKKSIKEAADEATRLALEGVALQVKAALESGMQQGHAAGLEQGRGEAATALSAITRPLVVDPPSTAIPSNIILPTDRK